MVDKVDHHIGAWVSPISFALHLPEADRSVVVIGRTVSAIVTVTLRSQCRLRMLLATIPFRGPMSESEN